METDLINSARVEAIEVKEVSDKETWSCLVRRKSLVFAYGESCCLIFFYYLLFSILLSATKVK